MSPRSKEQNEQIKDERREQLLSAALKVISHRGLAATKIGDIAAAAGLSHGLVYHYFDSKDDIFTELVRRAVTSSASVLLEAEKLPLEPLEKMRAITAMTLKGIQSSEDSAYYFFMIMQAFTSDSGPAEARELARGANTPSQVVQRIVEEGMAKGQIRQGAAQDYVTAYWACIQGLAMYKIAIGAGFSQPDPDILVRMFQS